METLATALPTLLPEMLLGLPRPLEAAPFSHPRASFFYFARNAVFRSVEMLGLRGGEVLVPAYHHGVEVEALLAAGAQVRFYRVGPRWDVDPHDVAAMIGPQTRAIYLIHYAGRVGPAVALRELADRHGLALIEDCALSLLARGSSGEVGLTGDVGIFCLYKTLPVPNGGALVLNRPAGATVPSPRAPPLASTLSHTLSSLLANPRVRNGRSWRWAQQAVRNIGRGTVRLSGIKRVATGTQHFCAEHLGLGMSNLSHWIAARQNLPLIVERRRRNYLSLLARLGEAAPPFAVQLPEGACPLFFPIWTNDRDGVLSALRAGGIEAIDFWRHFHPSCDASAFTDTARLRQAVVEIPCHQDLELDRLEEIAVQVKSALVKDRKTHPRGARR